MSNKYRYREDLPYFIESLMSWSKSAEKSVHKNLDKNGYELKVIKYSFAVTSNEDNMLIKYDHFNSSDSFIKPNVLEGFRAFTNDEKRVIRNELEKFEDFSNIKFVESNNADMTFFLDNLINKYGPLRGSKITGYGYTGGDVHLNSVKFSELSEDLGSDRGRSTILHEIGHALGFKHTHSDGSSNKFIKNGTVEPWLKLEGEEDNVKNSVMSYIGLPQSKLGDFDIAALHYIYGVGNQHRSGNDTYTHLDNYIWDGSGIDLINLSKAESGAVLNLSEGSWNSIGQKTSSILDQGQFFIGYDTNIENAIGTEFNDFLMGSNGNNSIRGGSGKDIILGHEGKDFLDGGSGADFLLGGLEDDIYIVDDSKDQIYEYMNEGVDTVYSSVNFKLPEHIEKLHLKEGVFIGVGNKGDNSLFGNAINNMLLGNDGDDFIQAYVGDDQLYGGDGLDRLDGGEGNDLLKGNNGNDLLNGGKGKDILFGGHGRDVFQFQSLSDTNTELERCDVIKDFETGIDKIDLSAIDGNTAVRGNQSFTLIDSNREFSHAGQVKFKEGILYLNTDNDIDAEALIRINTVINIYYFDII